MKLRTKAVLFLGSIILAIAILLAMYAQYIVGTLFKKQTISSFRSIAEQTESAYVAFTQNMKTRALDWASDSTLRNIAKEVIDAPQGSQERQRLEKEFAAYIVEKKMPFDKTIFLTDLLDRDGIVVASTRMDRIGVNEKKDEDEFKAHYFSKTISSKFGEAFTRSIVVEEDESHSPVLRATVRLAVPDKDGNFEPIDAVLLLHFANMQELHQVLTGVRATTGGATQVTGDFVLNHETSDVYLVNNSRLLVTPTRLVKDVNVNQKIDTLPVRECFDNKKEVQEEYNNYKGTRVLGTSMCFEDEGLVLLVEINKDEIYAPLTLFIRLTALGGVAALFAGVFIVVFFVRKPFSYLDEIILVAKRVSVGNLEARAEVKTKDEIGYLASVFNSMIESVFNAQKELVESKRIIEEKSIVLEEDLRAHKKQEELLEQSKKATLNLLEDLWHTKELSQVESNRLQTIITSIADSLVIIDTEYRIVLVNPKAEKMFALNKEELMGKDLRSVVTMWKTKDKKLPIEKWPTEEMFASKAPVVTTIEDELFVTTTQQKVPIPVTLSISPLTGDPAGAVIVVRDATSDYELDEAKSGFVSVASHQLRTPLTSIRWYSEMLLSGDVGELNDMQKDFMGEIHGGAERLYQTVDLLLGISRVESGKIKVNKESVDLTKFTEDIKKELSSQINEKELNCSFVAPEGEPVVVSTDPITLRQVILNLFSNAIRYTEKQGEIKAVWRIDEEKKEVVYSVSDNGIGIPEDQKSRIFSKFFRAENARAHIPDGSGLGLALVKDLVESWGGKVWFESRQGEGTTFYFTIPL